MSESQTHPEAGEAADAIRTGDGRTGKDRTGENQAVDPAEGPTPEEQFAAPAEVLRELDLGPDEALRLLDPGPRLVLLERCEPDAALPVTGPPVVACEVSAYPFADLFRWIEETGRSGYLHFQTRGHVKSVFVHRGEVVFASSNQLVDRLGESLLRAGVLSLEQLREAQRCFTPRARMGRVLVERGFLSPRELWSGVKYQVEEIVRSLFAYTAGRVWFWEGDSQPDNVVRLSLPTHRLISEGLQRREELTRFLAVLEEPEVELRAVKEVDAELSGAERALADLIPTENRFPDLCEQLGLDRESAARSVQLLRLVGAVKLVRPEVVADDFMNAADLVAREESDALGETLRTLTKLIGELAAPIVEADGDEGLRERLGDTLDDAATRFPELLGSTTLGTGATLDPEPLIERARGLGEDAEGQVLAALGELIAYLEFEIMNHPGIDDPQEVLASVAELRASL